MTNLYRFFKQTALFIIIFFACDFIIGKAISHLYFSEKKGSHVKTTYAIDSAKQDVIVFGSSRAMRHYSPRILMNGSGFSCYNAGRDAQKIPFYTAVEEVIFNRKKPKLVLLDVNLDEFNPDENKYATLTILLPYCKKHPELIKYLKEVSPYEPYKLISTIYPYNSSIVTVLYNHLFADQKKADDQGYLPLDKTVSEEQMAAIEKLLATLKTKGIKEDRSKIDKKAVGYFRRFLDQTKNNHIPTVVIISPFLFPQSSNPQIELLKKIALEYPNVTFKDFSHDEDFLMKRELFADDIHLNIAGSEKYSEKINLMLKSSGLILVK